MKRTYAILSIILLLSMNVVAIDTWTQKADFGGAIRHWSVGFAIGNKGYMGTGYGAGVYRQDIWEYDPVLDVWTQMANFGGGTRFRATGFSIGTKGYICAGTTSSAVKKKDLWEFDPIANTWTAKTDFPGTARELATAFTIGAKAYFGTGYDGAYKRDMYEYDQATDTWLLRAPYTFSSGTAGAVSFAIGSKGYVGTGYYTVPSGMVYFHCYDPATNTWSPIANISGSGFREAIAFSIGGKGYVGIGQSASSYSASFYEYDPVSDGWTPKTNFTPGGRYQAVGFAIGNKGYVGTGIDGSAEYRDFWEWKNCSAAPSTPSAMSGTNLICTGSVNNYSIPAVSGATSYTWTLPGGWTGTSATNAINTTAGTSPGTVTISVVANNACGSSSAQTLNVTVSACTGVQETNLENQISLFPNPAVDDLTLVLAENIKDAKIEIRNITGQLIHAEMINSDAGAKTTRHFNTSAYAKGMYVMSIESEGAKTFKKFVVK